MSIDFHSDVSNNPEDSRVRVPYSASEGDSYSPDFWGQRAARVCANGFVPIPLHPFKPDDNPPRSKRPAISRWNEIGGFRDQTEVDWYCKRFSGRGHGIGILCRGIVVFDCDFTDAWLLGAIEDIVYDVCGETDLVRTGLPPKVALVYGTNEQILSRESRHVKFKGGEEYLEILALNDDEERTAKQFVAFAIHPKTKEEYEWRGASPFDINRDRVLQVTNKQVDEVIRRVNDFFENNKEELARRGVVLVENGSQASERRKSADYLSVPPAAYEDLEIKPLAYLKKSLERIRQSILTPKRHRHQALYTAAVNASEIVHSFRFEDEGSETLEKARAEEIAHDTLLEATHDAIQASPDDWTIERALNHIERGWKAGAGKRRASEARAATAAWKITYSGLLGSSQSAGSAASAAQQQSVSPPSTSTAAWTDRNQNTHENLRPARHAVTFAPTMPIAQLQQQVKGNVAAFFAAARDFHTDRDRVVGIADQAAASYSDRFLTGRVRSLMGEGAGSGKTTAICDELADFYSDPVETRNVLYCAPTHVMAEQTQRELEGRGVPTIRLHAPEVVCSVPAHKKAIEARKAENLPVQDICKACPARKTCPYPAQFSPASGSVIVAQHAQLAMDRLPVINEAGSSPLFASIIDESPLAAVLQVTSLSMETLGRRIKLPPISQKITDPQKRKELDDTRTLHAVSINECCRRLRSAVARVEWPEDRERETTKLVTKASLQWFFDRGWDGRTRAQWLLHDVSEARAALLGRTMEKARKTGTSNIRSAEAHALRVMDHISNVLNAIVESDRNKLDVANLHAKRICMKNGRTYFELSAGYLNQLPKSVASAPILFIDATGDMRVIESILREDSRTTPRLEDAPSTLIRAEDVHRPVFRQSHGEADAPFLTSEKYIASPTKARQLTAGSPEAKKRRAKGSVTLNSAEYRGGQRVAKTKKRTGWLHDLRSDSHAKQVERELRSIVHERKADGYQRIAIFTILDVERELRIRKWVARAGVEIDHFGNLAGRNDFKDFDAIILVGQMRPPTSHLGVAGGALASAHPRARSLTVPRFHNVHLPIEIGGQPFELRAPILDDDFSEVARQQIELAQSVQAYGRLRAHLRDAGHPCKLIALDSVPGGRWSEAVVFEPPDELTLFNKIHGRLPANGAEAFQMEPELFRSRRHARELMAVVVGTTTNAGMNIAPATIDTSKLASAPVSIVNPKSVRISFETPIAPSSNPPSEALLSYTKGYRHLSGDPHTFGDPPPAKGACNNKNAPTGHVVTTDPRSQLSRITADLYAKAEVACRGKPARMAHWLSERTGEVVTRDAIIRLRKARKRGVAAKPAPPEAPKQPSAGHADLEKSSQKPQDGQQLLEALGQPPASQSPSAALFTAAIDTPGAPPQTTQPQEQPAGTSGAWNS